MVNYGCEELKGSKAPEMLIVLISSLHIIYKHILICPAIPHKYVQLLCVNKAENVFHEI